MTEPDFTIGIEEEYLLVDRDSLGLAIAPDALMAACRAEMAGQVGPESLQCQIAVGTRVCAGIAEARDDLRRLRACVSRHAADHGLVPIAASCHQFSDWKNQHHTDKERYTDLGRDLGGVARRMLICGMHVHVGIPDEDMRIDLVNQLSYFLPHLLAASSGDVGLIAVLAGRGYRACQLSPHRLRQPAADRAAAAVHELGRVPARGRSLRQDGADRGFDADMVGPAPLRPLPDHRKPDLRCLAPARDGAVAGGADAVPDPDALAADACQSALAGL